MIANKLKGFAKDSFLYGLGDGLGRLAGLIMLPILSRAFVPADYGAIDLLTVSYLFLGSATRLNTGAGFQKFFYKSDTEYNRNILNTSVSFFLLLVALLVAISGYLLAPCISQLVIHDKSLVTSVRLLAVCLPVELFFGHLQLLLRLQRKAIVFSIINIAQVILLPVLTYIFVVILHAGITGVFVSKLLSTILLTVALFVYSRKSFGTTVSLHVYKNLVIYTLPGYPGTLIKGIMDIIPRYILAMFAPLTAIGLFGVAFRITQVLNMFIMAFNRAWNPFAFAHSGASDEKSLYSIIFKIFSFILILLSLGLSLFAKEALQILTPPQYHSAYNLVGGLAFFMGVQGLVLIFSTALYSVNQVKWTSYLNSIQLCVFFVMALLLVPHFETAGLIISLDVATAVFFVCYMLITKKFFRFDMQIGKLLVMIGISTFIIVFFNSINLTLIKSLATKSFAIVIFFPLAFIFILNKNEKYRIVSWLQSKKHLCFSNSKVS